MTSYATHRGDAVRIVLAQNRIQIAETERSRRSQIQSIRNTHSVQEEQAMSETKTVSEVSFEDFKKLDARVGIITQVERVPRTEKLYKILVDLGTLGIRQTVSSLVGYYEPDQLMGKRVIFLCNLKPTKFGGEVSQGMLLAAEKEKGLALLTTDHEIPNGARVT